MADDIREIIEKYALQNAVKYNAAPQTGAVMGKVMGEHPDLRPRAKEVAPVVASVLEEVAKMSREEWQSRLEEIAPQLLAELGEKKEPVRGLPPLKGTDGEVVMRFAPNPNGPPTLGSARGIIINSEYVRRYGGKFILRFDDTDPVNKRPMLEAYDWYLEDCKWLDATPDEVVIASDRLPKYYEIAEDLIQKGAAYVCSCDQATFKKYKGAAKPCPHRDQDDRQRQAGCDHCGARHLEPRHGVALSARYFQWPQEWTADRLGTSPQRPEPEVSALPWRMYRARLGTG